MESFSLYRWYADCVTEDGQGFLGHASDLAWGPARIRYSGSVTVEQGDWPALARSVLTGTTFPKVSPGKCEWQSPRLGFDGTWTARAEQIERRIYTSEGGSVVGRCIIPAGTAEIRMADGRRISGHGYVDRIDLSIPPWQIPINELHWGRFITDQHSILWVEWKGTIHARLAYLDGIEVAWPTIQEDQVDLGTAMLEFGSRKVIQEGTLDQALSGIPSLQALIPASVLAIEERKWLTEARMIGADGSEAHGWAIHQSVRWPNAK